MKEKRITKISLLINSILFLIAGITIICFKSTYLNLFHMITSILIICLGILSLILNIIKTKKIKDILISITTLSIGVFFYYNQKRFLSLFPLTFGLYMFLNGTIKFVTYIIFKNREKENFYFVLLGSLIDFIFSYIMIIEPSKNINKLAIILGIYLILFSLTYFKDFLKECFPEKKRKKGRGIRITIPIIFSVMIPYQVLLKINNLLNHWKTPVEVKKKRKKEKADLEILIHVKDTNIGRFGHADLCYKGIVYSYGCYDEDSKKLFESIGDGTLFEIKGKEKYIKFCTNNADKTIFSFGIALTDKEKEKIEYELNKLKSYTYKWENVYEYQKKRK